MVLGSGRTILPSTPSQRWARGVSPRSRDEILETERAFVLSTRPVSWPTWEQKLEQARRAEELVDAVLDEADLDRHRVVVVSDHGNLEEGTHTRHTLNPVPLLSWGHGADALVDRVDEMVDLTPALIE